MAGYWDWGCKYNACDVDNDIGDGYNDDDDDDDDDDVDDDNDDIR